MSYKAPIKLESNYHASSMVDANGKFVELTDIARDLTAYYRLLEKQAECQHKQAFHSHCGRSVDVFYEPYFSDYCPDCGKQLIKRG